MARHFREAADETQYPAYVQMMTRTADELESLALELEGVPELMR